MKWILVSTNPVPYVSGTHHPDGAGWNVGDVFARLGVEQLVREVDPDAVFGRVNMDSEVSIVAEQTFDRAVFAGRPMFWHGCERHALWTHLLRGWLCKEPRKVIALGVGDCYPLQSCDGTELAMYHRAASTLVWRLTTRRRGSWDFGACPSTWLLLDRPEPRTRRLVNFMRPGGHYPDFSKASSAAWAARLPATAPQFIEAGFEFIAHSLAERRLAVELGWDPTRIVFHSNAWAYLSTYASAREYVGNRVHGGLVLASRPANVCVVGNDTRILAAAAIGIQTRAIEYGDVSPLEDTPANMIVERQALIRDERAKALSLLREFAQ